ncbi:helix-turn-helix transcriptional regulator [Salmonella enterica subsp. enterica serovar Braenderup]|uniref:helix-turn-helix transcriptional regulator n=1 Tax=Salmonella enterica TaxID=28901 RepID=UPI0009AEB058|nr:helix-turn-helix transcriptional regulator [Salmonella enterica]EAY7466423.1 helix-turn-helix transcriptional regulator [Salmonella enterica]ECB6452968.1 XRE family transcriptional regulator [Salmonella enterica subsp. enterica serovar Newport]EEJ6505026.1 helix-turn-helix transcriptional regulator [Salmonella enterica subsp. enterica serovar Braenderup]EEJ8616060.1 helix-turn-helix transcriptional regulator [Salmonella enterica subsp. enterica serovar Veneziana]
MSTTVAMKIRIMRKSEMLTQEKMAEITGITLSALRQYEQGRNEPNLESTKKLLKSPIFRKYRDWFLFDEMEPKAGQVIPALARVGQDETESPHYESNSGE